MQQLSSGRVEPKPLDYEQVTDAAATTVRSHSPQSADHHSPTNGHRSSPSPTNHTVTNQAVGSSLGLMNVSPNVSTATGNNNALLYNGVNSVAFAGCNVCNESSIRSLNEQRLHLQCGFCAVGCRLDTNSLNVHELHALVSPNRHPGLQWKCNNCQQQPIMVGIEHQLQLMSRQLMTLTAKVEAIARINLDQSNGSNHNTSLLHDTSRTDAATCRSNFASSGAQWSFVSAPDAENSLPSVGYSQRPPQPANSAMNSTVLGSGKSRALRSLNVDFTPITDKISSSYHQTGHNSVAQKALAFRKQNTIGTPDSVFSELAEQAEHEQIDEQNQIQIYMDSGDEHCSPQFTSEHLISEIKVPGSIHSGTTIPSSAVDSHNNNQFQSRNQSMHLLSSDRPLSADRAAQLKSASCDASHRYTTLTPPPRLNSYEPIERPSTQIESCLNPIPCIFSPPSAIFSPSIPPPLPPPPSSPQLPLSLSVNQPDLPQESLPDIPPPALPAKEYLLCVLSHIESPSEFYVHITDEEVNNAIDDLSEQLSTCYASGRELPFADIPSNELRDRLLGRCFAAFYLSDQNWYRVRVLHVQPAQRTCTVQYLDYGNTEQLSVDELNLLRPELAEIPALALRCSLAHVQPPPASNQSDLVVGGIFSEQLLQRDGWTEEQTLCFQNLSGFDREQLVTAHVIRSVQLPQPHLEVLLWNNALQPETEGSNSGSTSHDLLVNLWLVRQGLAVSDRLEWLEEAERWAEQTATGSADENGLDSSEQIEHGKIGEDVNEEDNFDELSDQGNYFADKIGTSGRLSPSNQVLLSSYPNSLPPPLPPPKSKSSNLSSPMPHGTAAKKLSPSASAIVSEFVAVSQRKSLEVQDQPSQSGPCSDHSVVTNTLLDNGLSPVFIAAYPTAHLRIGRTVFMKVTHADSPHHFYGVMPFGAVSYDRINVETEKQLMERLITAPESLKYKELCTRMKNYYSKPANSKEMALSRHQLELGHLVIIREDQSYARARILAIDDLSSIAQVRCIDSGRRCTVPLICIFKVKPDFATLHEFAVRCSMPNIEPINPVHGRRVQHWFEQTRCAFSEYTTNNIFLANILRIAEEGHLVQLELLNIFEEQENVDDHMINRRLAQKVPSDLLIKPIDTSVASSEESLADVATATASCSATGSATGFTTESGTGSVSAVEAQEFGDQAQNSSFDATE